MRWLRTKLAGSTHRIAFFADAPGGVFNESFPAVAPFPALTLLVPLHGRLELDTEESGGEQTRSLHPPEWGLAEEDFRPASAPAVVPFGRSHAVRTLAGSTSCWAYVFGIDSHAEERLTSPSTSHQRRLERRADRGPVGSTAQPQECAARRRRRPEGEGTASRTCQAVEPG